MLLAKRLLNRMERRGWSGKPLDGQDLAALGLYRQHQAGTSGSAVDEDCAGAADAMLAAKMRAGQTNILTQHIGQQFTHRYAAPVGPPVHFELDRCMCSTMSRHR